MGKSNMLDLSSLVPAFIGTQALLIPQVLPHHGNAVPSLIYHRIQNQPRFES